MKNDRIPMIQIEDTIISIDCLSEKFCCDLDACKGECCIEGDAGAPVELDEVAELEEALRKTDREAMRRIVHRMAPVWELLGANDVLSGYRMLLHDRISSDETVREYTMRIMKQIRLLIDEVNNELRKKNDGDEKNFIDRGGQPDSLRYS